MQGGTNALMMNLFPFIIIMVIFYFLLIRPQQKQMKERQNMLNNLKVGDKILTVGGLIGTITSIKENELEVEIAKNIKVTIVRTAVSNVLR